MAIKIVKKKNIKEHKVRKTVIITILGTLNKENALYVKNRELDLELKEGMYKNMFPLLCESFGLEANIKIIPIFTRESNLIQSEVVPSFDIEKEGYLIDEENFDDIFNTINTLIADEDEADFIIDITHGFRHLPILATVSMIINNFQNSSKIAHILFAKEIEKFKKYEIIDLKNYLEIANISFVLNTFDDNYTVATHIQSRKYNSLIVALNEFSNDIMALNLSNLNDSSLPNLVRELDKIEDKSIKNMACELKEELSKDFSFESKRYLTFYKIAKNLYEKNYILLSLSLLYESIRIYLKTAIKQDYHAIIEKLEKYYEDDLYKLGDFVKNLEKKPYKKLKESEQDVISEIEYKKLQERFPHRMPTPALMKEIMNTRNDLSHANSKEKFSAIKKKTYELITRYNQQYKLEEKLLQ